MVKFVHRSDLKANRQFLLAIIEQKIPSGVYIIDVINFYARIAIGWLTIQAIASLYMTSPNATLAISTAKQCIP